MMLLGAAAAAAVATTAVPASAQVFFGADPYGAGVQVGPLGVGVGPRFDGRYYRDWDDSYAAGYCRVIKSKVVRPDGRVIYQTRRVCD
jgi:hypothetical protein